MAKFFLSEEAERELDEVWLYIARESGSLDVATRAVDSIYRRFWLLANHPYTGRNRDEDLRPGLRTFPADNYTIVYRIGEDQAGDDLVLILHLIHSNRDLVTVLRQ